MILNCKGSCDLCVATTTSSSTSCTDKDAANCPGWANSGYCTSDKYGTWMSENCIKSCDFCSKISSSSSSSSISSSSSSSSSTCADTAGKEEDCGTWKKFNYCTSDDYVGYMQENCRKTCNFCSSYSSSMSSCTDVNVSDCPGWADLGHCTGGQYRTWMSENCMKSCSVCVARTCYDVVDCADKYPSYCYDDKYTKWMTDNCSGYCNNLCV